jgi:hypothetical protein
VLHETSTEYRRPYRPWAVAWANRVGRTVGLSTSLAPRDLLAEARRRTKLGDFGDPSFHEPMGVLLRSIEREARLTPLGRLITRERLVGVLANRLRVSEARRREPGIVQGRLEPPVIITGLQRTGTTLLHRLLATDPRRRWLASWEALHPAPPLDGPDGRIRNAERAQRALQYLAPDFFAVHPVRARGPEEDVLLLDYAFRSTVPEATLRVPSYSRWLEEQDQRPAYEYMATLLRMLSAQRKPEARWLLKTPHHLEWLDVLLDVFPGAKVVWTHRDPAVAVPSFCSMVAHGRGVFSDHVDPLEIGREWGRKTARLVDRALAARDRAPEGTFFDLPYDELTADPLAAVRRIYAFLGDELDDDVLRRMRATLEGHPQHAFGRHVYRPEDFGLRPAAIRERFADYARRFLG